VPKFSARLTSGLGRRAWLQPDAVAETIASALEPMPAASLQTEDRMTRRVGNVVILEEEPPTTCARCKRVRETRPVLEDGTRLCHDCATPEERNAYGARLFGSPRDDH
jgi:hypothetical protein